MVAWNQCPTVEREAEKLGGAWVFKGTRVPVEALFESLQGGASADEFLNWFPGVTREQVEAVLEYSRSNLDATAMEFVGAIEGDNPGRAENARSEVKARIARRHTKVPDVSPDPGDEL